MPLPKLPTRPASILDVKEIEIARVNPVIEKRIATQVSDVDLTDSEAEE